jgi:cation transporter-like permease
MAAASGDIFELESQGSTTTSTAASETPPMARESDKMSKLLEKQGSTSNNVVKLKSEDSTINSSSALETRPTTRENDTMSKLLVLERERQELTAKLAANMERQRALAQGMDVEKRAPRVALVEEAPGCAAEPSAWAEECDVDLDLDIDIDARNAVPDETLEEFARGALSRGSWLVGLLAAQSLSGAVLQTNEAVIQRHPVIVFFLTMLVGAGGNAGNQAAVRIIRGLAVGAIVPGENGGTFVLRELRMALCLASALAITGFCRVYLFTAATTIDEAYAITLALFLIVFLSVVLGAALPILLERLGVGASNAATTIQVVMDVSGVLITVVVCQALLDGISPLQALFAPS